jgi:hypothetical protein
MRLHVALEVAERHAERGSSISPAEREMRMVRHAARVGQVAAACHLVALSSTPMAPWAARADFFPVRAGPWGAVTLC